jgi:hypothetical protein
MLEANSPSADVIVAQRAKRQLQPFSFSTFGQGVAIGRYPDDKQKLFILNRHPSDDWLPNPSLQPADGIFKSGPSSELPGWSNGW